MSNTRELPTLNGINTVVVVDCTKAPQYQLLAITKENGVAKNMISPVTFFAEMHPENVSTGFFVLRGALAGLVSACKGMGRPVGVISLLPDNEYTKVARFLTDGMEARELLKQDIHILLEPGQTLDVGEMLDSAIRRSNNAT